MAFNLDSALGIHPQALALRAKRAEVLARNIHRTTRPAISIFARLWVVR